MQYFPEIIPLFEAYTYLSQRFSANRTIDRIRHFEPRKEQISVERWTCFERIAEFQKELDERIPADELMERYFKPLKTKEEIPGDRTITLGGLLLRIPPALEPPFSYDGLIEYYAVAPQQDLLDHFYCGSLAPFFTDNEEMNKISMSAVVSAVNGILVDTEDKWAVIDCVTNPSDHLERLRPLVEQTIKLVADRTEEFCTLLSEELKTLGDKNALSKKLGVFMRTDLKPKDLLNASVYMSLLSFNGIDMSYKEDTFEINRVILGIFFNTLLELKGKESNSSVHVQLLKMLSDQTRFNILHELCDRESYGQELADKFGGARSAIYYHLEKLLGYGLVDLEMTEYRMLYTMNKQNVYDKMNAIRDYLLNGWKPEDEPDADAETPETGGESGADK